MMGDMADFTLDRVTEAEDRGAAVLDGDDDFDADGYPDANYAGLPSLDIQDGLAELRRCEALFYRWRG